jgi:G3E family GTPase
MTKLYLVTGFLGAGKTTFLQRFVTLFHDQKLALVINEFGKRGVDGLLLSHLNTSINEINNGSIFCACRLEEFEHALLELQTQQPDVIIVEASGLSDPTTVGTILGQKDRFPDIEYAGAICVADGVRFHKVYQTARVCKMQLAVSDLVLINKADVATQDHIDEIKTVALAQKPNRPVHETTYGEMKQEWLEELRTPNEEDGSTAIHTHDVTLQKLSLRPMGFSSMELAVFLKRIAEDTYRIKRHRSLDRWHVFDRLCRTVGVPQDVGWNRDHRPCGAVRERSTGQKEHPKCTGVAPALHRGTGLRCNKPTEPGV